MIFLDIFLYFSRYFSLFFILLFYYKNHFFYYSLYHHLQLFLNWIGITENSFYYLIDQHRNKKLWQRNENWNWELKSDFLIENIIDEKSINAKLELIEKNAEFIITKEKKSSDKDKSYILIGKGV